MLFAFGGGDRVVRRKSGEGGKAFVRVKVRTSILDLFIGFSLLLLLLPLRLLLLLVSAGLGRWRSECGSGMV